MAVGVTTWLGVTVSSTTGDNVPTSGDILVVSGAQSDVMSGITAIQTTLADMQIKINTLVGGITVADVATWPAMIAPTPTPMPALSGTQTKTR